MVVKLNLEEKLESRMNSSEILTGLWYLDEDIPLFPFVDSFKREDDKPKAERTLKMRNRNIERDFAVRIIALKEN